ncbi:MAG TPA: SDR family oxidoreductase [Burkholderiaceae bacterium]|jgi:NAD(P)-dependent dehydrogenase (short-subunit alcohol dehydrogenase family)
MKSDKSDSHKNAADAAADKQRHLQHEGDEHQKNKQAKDKKSDKEVTQDGARQQPKPPFPDQHLVKPGEESALHPRPQFTAPDYVGSNKLRNMVALITGGDSGIGRAVAVLYAREGADIAIIYLNEHEDAEETKRYVEKEGRRCLLIAGDIKDADFCNDAVQQTIDEFGKLDILINNAAFQEHAVDIEEMTEEQFDETIRTNLYGYFHMAKAALPHLHSGSSIINTGSETGIFGSKELLDYSATKGAIHAFTKALATNVLSKGIRVNAIAPGPVWTPLNPADRQAEAVSQFGGKTEMKRPAQPEELSPAYVFLASPVCSSYITGIVLPVLGGATGSP